MLPNFLWPVKLTIMKKALKSIGSNVQISSDSHFDNYDKVYIGNNVIINRGFHCSNEKNLTIKDRVLIAPHCTIIGGDHDYSNKDENMRFTNLLGDNREIVIEEDVWIGHGTILLKKTFIGEGTIVGAASLVNTKLKPYSVYAGNPAKFIKPRFKTFEELKIYLNMMQSRYDFNTCYSDEELNEIYK